MSPTVFPSVVIRLMVKIVVQPFVLLPCLRITMCFSVTKFPMICTMIQIVVMTVVGVGGTIPVKVKVLGLC